VLIYSDGVPDAQNVRGEAFTPAGVLRALGGAPSGAPRGLVDRLRASGRFGLWDCNCAPAEFGGDAQSPIGIRQVRVRARPKSMIVR